MDGIDEILRAEQDAAKLRRDAAEAAEALLGSAEGYRQEVLLAAQREGDAERARLLESAEQRAEARRAELRMLADVKNDSLRKKAAERMDNAAAFLAQRIAEV